MINIITKIKVKLGICPAKGCWRRGIYEINIKEINLKRHLCYKHTKELVKILEDKKTSEIKICEINNAPCNHCKPVCDDWIYKENHSYCFTTEEIDKYLGPTMKNTLMDIIHRIERDRSLEKELTK